MVAAQVEAEGVVACAARMVLDSDLRMDLGSPSYLGRLSAVLCCCPRTTCNLPSYRIIYIMNVCKFKSYRPK